MDILADLTENDLGQIGILFGDRKRLLKAIASGAWPFRRRPRRSRARPTQMAAGETNVGSTPSHADYAILSITEADRSGTRRTDCGVRSGLWGFSGLFGNSLAALSRLRFCGKAGLAAVSGGVETNRFCFPWGFASPIGDRQTSLLRAAGDRAMSRGPRSANSVGVEMTLAVFARGGRAARVGRRVDRVRPRAVKRKAPRL